MSEATSFILALIPLLLCPAFVGILILPTDIQLSVGWWVGFTSISLFLLVFHGLGAPRDPTFVALIVCTAMLAIKERHKLLSRGKLPEPFHRGTFWVFLAFLPLLIASCLITFSLPVSDFDAINIWFNKAKSLFYWQPFNQLPLCDYPNLGPMYWSFVMRFTAVEFESIGRLLFPLAYWFWALSLMALIRNTSSRVCLFIAPLIGYTFFQRGPFTNGYQDGLLALCAGMSAIFSLRLLFELGDEHRADSSGQCLPRFRRLYMVACLFGGVLAWIKNEGMMVGLILVLVTTALCLASTARHLRRSLVRAIIPGLLTFSGIALSWPAMELVHGVKPWVIQGGAFEFGRLSSVFQRLGRLNPICEYLRRYLQEQKTVVGLLFVLSVAMLILCPRKTLRPALFLWAVLVLHAAFVVLVFLTTRQDLAWHLATAFDRLMFQNTLIVASGLTLLMRICAEEALASGPPDA